MLDNKWHYIDAGEYPEVYGDYDKKIYPQIPCLVEDIGFFGIKYWNVKKECWDDEDVNDYFCDKDNIIRWRYLDALLNEK